ncbi:MAG: diaminopimelate epimerase [Saprospiraceae bacterium]|nr:diaminopimelate epimerase [Saprospiraceae bacterium]
MQELTFFKYQGAGNDFIMIDGFAADTAFLTQPKIEWLCNRRFGIGADGLIILRQTVEKYDFEMLYYNADGFPGSMCGNGGRCAFQFASDLQLIKEHSEFIAVDGPHTAYREKNGNVSLRMIDVSAIEQNGEGDFILDTGSPHFVRIVDNLSETDVVTLGRQIRQSERFRQQGINVNFIQIMNDGIKIATYERGVEDETLACGTGVTAAALVVMQNGHFRDRVNVEAKGGRLSITAYKNPATGHFENVWLTGPATRVFTGMITV